MKKSLVSIFAITVFLLASLGPALFTQTAQAADPTDWYTSVSGVLDTDTYLLYPYDAKLLKLGFSKFGELINSNTNVGLEYAGARDPFAPLAGATLDENVLPKNVWINGWFIDIRYNHTSWGYRNVWAGALFADLSDYGRPWLRVDDDYDSCDYEYQEAFNLPGRELSAAGEPVGTTLYNGGRKTNGTVITDDITVLYDGPRLFVAKLVNHVYDWYQLTNIKLHIVDVVLTIMFNKVKKEVVVLKDVKFIPTAKYAISPLTISVDDARISVPYGVLVQFSNREEWDLGLTQTGTTKYSSYVHFYTADNDEGQDTVYNEDWTMLPTLPPGVTVKGVTVNKYGSEPGASGTYDVAQIVSNDRSYVGWHAFWPSLSDYQADAGRTNLWHRAILADDRHDTDSYTSPNDEPFRSPLIVGEWDFLLSDTERHPGSGVVANLQFRGVSVYGITDRNDGDDADRSGGSDVIDREAQYQLDEVFNPWDLQQAVEKKSTRWVEFDYDTSGSYELYYKPVKVVSNALWDQYCEFSERVIDLTENELEARVGYNWRGQDTYTITFNDDGTATISGLDAGHDYKILYSTDTEYGYEDSITFANYTWSNVRRSGNYILNDEEFSFGDYWEDWLGATHAVSVEGHITITNATAIRGSHTWNYSDSFNPFVYDVKVFKEDSARLGVWEVDFAPTSKTDGGNTTQFDIDDIYLDWYVVGPDLLDLHIDYLDIEVTFTVTLTYNATSGNYTVNLVITFEPWRIDYLYLEHIPGRYEWGIVGRDAASVDSAGLSMVSAAFKNKQVEYGLAGADMYDPLPYNQMPWVMSKPLTDDEWQSYYYSETDYRTALKDDWCTTWPISSSNMIGVGGPLANLLAYYGNDFTQAIFALSDGTKYGDFTDYAAWENKIIPLTCWDITKTQAYSSNNTVGYAVISTYKDINGTVLFLIWGHWGRDTYYVTKWFHEEGIYQLQEAPSGLTSIIVEIDYESTSEGYKPTGFSIVECLGTISETEWTHGDETKGGIHDP